MFHCGTMDREEQVVSIPDKSMLNGADIVSDNGCTRKDSSQDDVSSDMNDMAHVKTNVHSASDDLLDADVKCESDTCHVNGDMNVLDESGDNQLPVCDNLTLTNTLCTTDCQSSNIQENTQTLENEQIFVSASDGVGSNEVKGNCNIHEGCMKIEELADKINANVFHEIEDEQIPIHIESSAETPNFHSDVLNSTASDKSLLKTLEDQTSEFDVSCIQETNHKIETSTLVYLEKDQICIAPLNDKSETSSDNLEPTIPEVDNRDVVECPTVSISDASSHLTENDMNKESDACSTDIVRSCTTNFVIDEKDSQLDCYETVKQNVCDVENKEEKKESSIITFPKPLSKGQKLDQLLSKITHKAESDTQSSSCIPKQAKARKSFAPSSNVNMSIPPPLSMPSSIPVTCLTFNVKELEKQGVLDVPKPSKRKAFEPIKKYANLSPVLSTVKSPNKSENPLIKNKLTKNKRKRTKHSGVYRLPGEKNFKKLYKNRKKDSKERQLNQEEEKSTSSISNMNDLVTSETHKIEEKRITEKLADQNVATNEADLIMLDERKSVSRDDNEMNVCALAKSSSTTQSMQNKNALDIVTQNSRLAFTSSSATKKAKKSVQHGIDPSTNRTLDFFLKSGSHSQQIANKRKIQECASNQPCESIELVCGERQNRKAKDALKAALTAKSFADSSLASPEEKKRKLEGSLLPAPSQMITLLPAGSVPLNLTSAIIPSTIAGAGHQIIFTPCSTTGAQTLVQNGTLNGLPMFQLVHSQTVSSPQTAQFVAIAQSPHSQGQSLLANNSQRTTPLIQPKGMPLILTPFHVPTSSTNCSQPQMISSKTGLMNSMQNTSFRNQLIPVSTVMPLQSPHHKLSNSVLKNSLTQPRMQLPNGQYIDMKQMSHKDTHVLNGLYPVTPPQTPEEQRSYGGSHQGTSAKTETVSERPASPDRDSIPLCTCKISGASFQKMSTAITFCQALDSVDGKVLGCCNKVTNPQLVRPAVKIPFLAVCENHRKRLRLHQCCPGCGHFCTQGKFLQCKKDGSNFIHHFHEPCQVSKDGKNYCPHCGELSTHYEIQLTMCDNSRSSVPKEIKPKKNQTKARIGLLDRRSAGSGDDTGDECTVSHVQEKSKKLVSTNDVLVGPDRYSLERVLSSLTQERPKKYRNLPKCLYTPAYDNDLERVVYMLEDGHNPNEKYDDLEGQSALHAAAAVGSLAIVHVLIQAGASPHLQDLSLKTPLMFAAEMNHPDVVSYLIKANAIIDAKADDGMTALHFAAKAGHVNIIKILLDTDKVKIDIKDDGGWTPLIWAAEHQQVDAVKLLLQKNADPNLRDSEENTTMHWAAFSGSVAIAELLLAAGCDLDSLNMHGDRPLHIAARQDHYECVVLFLARGADVEAKNNKGETPLECCLDQNSAVYLALKVNKQLKSFGVKHMGKPEKLLHRDLSKGRENIPIPCVNGVDEEGIPTDYLYVTDNIETQFLKINRVIISLQSCQCKDDCSSMYCACGKNSLRCWYDKYGRLAPDFNMQEPPLIFECNRACECWTTCNNRVVQNGVMSRLQVFKTNSRGWGCKTLVDIPRGTFICEYIGEHISDSEADRREDDSYLFDLDNKDGETFCIDARRYGNVARFINHLCQPNLVPVKVFVDYQDLRFPRICLFASRDISAQEELGFNYGDRFWIIKWKQFTCTCDSQKCRYSKDTIQKTLEEYRQRHEIDVQEMQE